MNAFPNLSLGGKPVAAPQPKAANAAAALRLASAGLHVFPCDGSDNKETKKRPLGGIRWRDESSCDLEIVSAWWERWPDAIIGLDVGKAGLIVVDADRHPNAPDGVAALPKLIGGPTLTLRCPVVETAGNGIHLIFRQPEGETFGNSSGALPKGIDVRGQGGYIVAPGSTRADGAMWSARPGTPDLATAFETGTIPVLPEKIAALIRSKPERLAAPVTDAVQSVSLAKTADVGLRERAFAQAALDGCAAELASCGAGGRNELLNKLAFRLARMVAVGWIDSPAVRAALRTACEANGYIRDKGQRAFDMSFTSGMRAGVASPHGPLEDRPRQDDAELKARGDQAAAALDAKYGGLRQDNGQQPDGGVLAAQIVDPLAGFIFHGDARTEPPPALIKGMLPRDGICILGGQSGAGKTFIACDISVALASGRLFFSHKVVERVGVVILAAEGANTIANRIAVASAQNEAGEILPIAWLGSIPDLSNLVEVKKMVRSLRAVSQKMQAEHGVRLGAIIIDTLAAAFNLKDENDNAEANRVIGCMNLLAKGVDAVVIPVHHYGKASETGLRGASAWRGGGDAVLSVMADRDHTTGKCRNRKLAIAKSRVGEEGWTAPFDLRFVELGEDEDGEAYGACCVEPGEAEGDGITMTKPKALPRAARAYIDALQIVVGEKGKKVQPFGSEGAEVTAVDRELVRDEFYLAWPADGEDDKARKNVKCKAFARGEAEALTRRQVYSYEVGGEHLVWLLAEPAL